MKGNKMKVKDVPSAYSLWLARLIHQSMVTKHRMPLSKCMLKKGRTTFGFTATARKMMDLGYIPKYARYPSTYAGFD